MATSLTPDALAGWLAGQVDGPVPAVSFAATADNAGFSGETVLVDVSWVDDRLPSGAYVLKMPPVDDPHPLFPTYDLHRQVVAMRLVADHTDAPVPSVPWWEPDPGPLGAPFVVMARMDGEVGSDVPPYTFGGWIADADTELRLRLERSFVGALADLHTARSADVDLSALELDDPGDTPLQRHVAHQRSYYEWIREERRFPLVEQAFEWLTDRWPEAQSPSGIVWGDARLANAMFRDGEVVALLDWENATVGPPEIDLAWTLYFGDYFQRIAERHGQTGLPGFMPAERVVTAYAALTGSQPQHLGWHLVYATLRQALTSIRVWERAVLRGQHPQPADPQDLIADRPFLEELLACREPLDLITRSS